MGLDVDKFLDFVTKEQRSLLIPFLISLPIVYTLLMLYVDGYADYDLFDRCIFAIATAVSGLSLSIATAALSKGIIPIQIGANMFVVLAIGNLAVSIIRVSIGLPVSAQSLFAWFLLTLPTLVICCSVAHCVKRKSDKNKNRKPKNSPSNNAIPK